MYVYLQGCRAIAALFVVFFHLSGNLAEKKYFGDDAVFLRKICSFGDCGVAFFFVLSGFIITLIHRRDFDHPQKVFHYARKRVFRIYPTYLIIFGFVYLCALASVSNRDKVPHDFATLAKCLLLLPQDKSTVGGTGAPVIAVAWTLQYEMVFYAAVAVAIINRKLFGLLLMVFVVNFGYCKLHGLDYFPQSFFANAAIFLFLIGMLVAYLAKSKFPLRHPILLSVVAGLGFISLAVFEAISGKNISFMNREIAYGIICAVLILGLVRTEAGRLQPVHAPFILLMGDASYCLYLIHYPLLSFLCKLAVKIGLQGIYGAVVSFVLITIICVLAALAFHIYVERPILSKLSGFSRRGSPKLAIPNV